MLVEYIQAAMKRAQYKILEEDSSYFGAIPEIEGVWANAETLERCREELLEVLDSWILLSVKRDLPIPDLDGVGINVVHIEDSA